MADSFGFAVDDVTQLPSFGILSSFTHGRCFGTWMSHEVFARKASTIRTNTVSFSSAIAATEQVETRDDEIQRASTIRLYDLKQVAIAPRLFPYFDLFHSFHSILQNPVPCFSILHGLQLLHFFVELSLVLSSSFGG